MKTLPVVECFPAFQGEGALIGRPTVFVRLGGCDFYCSWCDSLYAVLPRYKDTWQKRTAEEIIGEVSTLSKGIPLMITLSGGNPALHDLNDLLDVGAGAGYTFAMETQGSVYKPWFKKLNHLCVSPKPPSSGMKYDLRALQNILHETWDLPEGTVLKVVVGSEEDYAFARAVYVGTRGWNTPFYIQPCNPLGASNEAPYLHVQVANLKALQERVAADQWWGIAGVLPQLHVLLHGPKKGV